MEHDTTVISVIPRRHAKLTGIYNPSKSWGEFWSIVFFVGVPFALAFATIKTFLF